MTRYLLSVCYEADAVPPSADELATIMHEVTAVREALQAEGSWVFAGGLHEPGTATVVRSVDGSPVLTDGPFIYTKGVIGGFTIVDVADLDAANAWAARMAAATTCPIEVRPFVDEG